MHLLMMQSKAVLVAEKGKVELIQGCYNVKHTDLSNIALVSVVNFLVVSDMVGVVYKCTYTYIYLKVRTVCLITVHKHY